MSKRTSYLCKLCLSFLDDLLLMHSTMKKYQVAFTETTVENKKLKQENAQLEQSLEEATRKAL